MEETPVEEDVRPEKNRNILWQRTVKGKMKLADMPCKTPYNV
jgi:hypothetical protein